MEEARATVLDLNVLLASILKPEGYTAATLLTLHLRGDKLYVPDYVKEEFNTVVDDVAKRKGIDPWTLKTALQTILKITTEAKKKSYKKHLEKAKDLVRDPKDTPYVALALHLREHYKQVIILTYNKKDYKCEELQREGITVLTPRELQETNI
ncbi:MAG: PIN domain-containing protein [Desulfurococcales archaeon]|nr:PIN domain-containing protein [Desulfurococcales archaeon]